MSSEIVKNQQTTVDRIEVGDTQKVNGQRICEVKVYYRYVGNVDGALAQERGQDYGEAI